MQLQLKGPSRNARPPRRVMINKRRRPIRETQSTRHRTPKRSRDASCRHERRAQVANGALRVRSEDRRSSYVLAWLDDWSLLPARRSPSREERRRDVRSARRGFFWRLGFAPSRRLGAGARACEASSHRMPGAERSGLRIERVVSIMSPTSVVLKPRPSFFPPLPRDAPVDLDS